MVSQKAMVWNSATFNFSSLKTKLYLSFSWYSFLYPCFYYEFRPTSSNPSLSLSWVGQFMVSIFLTSSKNLLPDSYTLSWQGWLWFDSKWKICAIVNFILIFLPFTVWIWNKKKKPTITPTNMKIWIRLKNEHT